MIQALTRDGINQIEGDKITSLDGSSQVGENLGERIGSGGPFNQGRRRRSNERVGVKSGKADSSGDEGCGFEHFCSIRRPETFGDVRVEIAVEVIPASSSNFHPHLLYLSLNHFAARFRLQAERSSRNRT
jgi:hypothetical protein